MEVLEMNNEQNIEVYQLLHNISSFMIELYDGQILPKDHHNYYDGLIDIKLINKSNKNYGHIIIGKEKYQIKDETVKSIQTYIESNINKLINLSLNQKVEAEEYTSGGGLILNIKYKSILISIDEQYTICMNEKEQLEFYNFKNDIINTIKNILQSNK